VNVAPRREWPARPALPAVLGAAVIPVALAVAVGLLAPRPGTVALGAGALAGAVALARAARRAGALASWLALVLLSILAGGLGAISLGGQSGHLLWTDAVLAAGLVWIATRPALAAEWPRAPFVSALAWFLAWAGLSILIARDPLTAISEYKEWLVAAVVAVAAVAHARDGARARGLLGVTAVTGALIALHMLLVAATSPLGPLFAIVMKLVDLPWGRSNYLAGLLILALPVTLGLLGSSPRLRERLAWGALLIAQAAGLAISASKGAILALVVGLGVAYAADRRAPRVTRWVVVGVLAAGVLVFAAGPLQEVARYRLQQHSLEYSAGERMDLYRLAWREFLARPLTGVGLGNFEVISNRLHGVDTVPHNYELGFLCELGLPGLLLALAWMGALLRLAWRARAAAATPPARALAAGLWAAMVAFAVHNQFESTIYGEQYKIMLVVVAAAAWGVARPRNDARESG
jgi:hypothetical protein